MDNLALDELLRDLDQCFFEARVIEHLASIPVRLILKLLGVLQSRLEVRLLLPILLKIELLLLLLDLVETSLLFALLLFLLGPEPRFFVRSLLLETLLFSPGGGFLLSPLLLHPFSIGLCLRLELLLALLGLGLLLSDSLLLELRPLLLFLFDGVLDLADLLEQANHILLLLLLTLLDHCAERLLARAKLLDHLVELFQCLILLLLTLLLLFGLFVAQLLSLRAEGRLQ